MFVYIIMYLLLYIGCIYSFSVKKNKTNYNILVFISFLALFMHDGFRWEIGTDWYPYYDYFIQLHNNGVVSERYELLYLKLTQLVSFVTDNYNIFLLVHAFIVYLLIYKWLKAFIPNYVFVSLIVLYSTMIGFLGMNRQYIALVFCLFSSIYLIKKEYYKYVVLCIIAIGFHMSAIIFLIFPYFLKNRIKPKFIFFIFLFAFIFNIFFKISFVYEFLIKYIGGLAEEKSIYYINNENDISMINYFFSLCRQSLILIILYFCKRKIDWSNPFFVFSLNMYLLSMVMYILFYGQLQFLIGRLTIYFSVYSCVLYGFSSKNIPQKYVSLFLIFILIYSILCFNRSIKLYPELYIPYKSFLLN